MRVGASLRSGYGPMNAREGAQWMIERARAASDAGLDSLFVGDHHNVPVPYYQNVPMLGRLLAEWDARPAGALFLLPLWHPVLVAEQIGTLASIAAGPFIMQCALGGGAGQFAAFGLVREAAAVALRSVARRDPPAVRGRRGVDGVAVPDRAGPHRAGAARTARGVDRRVGAAGDRPRRAARRRVPRRAGGDARRSARAHGDATARPAPGTACTPSTIAIRRDIHVGADDADAERVAGPIVERGYRGFDPAAPVVGRPREGRRELRRARPRWATRTSSSGTWPTTRPRCCGPTRGWPRSAGPSATSESGRMRGWNPTGSQTEPRWTTSSGACSKSRGTRSTPSSTANGRTGPGSR